jgi:hypothetical protein
MFQDTSEDAIGDATRANCFKAPGKSHGVAQDTIHSQVAPQGTEGVRNADMAMY